MEQAKTISMASTGILGRQELEYMAALLYPSPVRE